jgi:hypothetical protein
MLESAHLAPINVDSLLLITAVNGDRHRAEDAAFEALFATSPEYEDVTAPDAPLIQALLDLP